MRVSQCLITGCEEAVSLLVYTVADNHKVSGRGYCRKHVAETGIRFDVPRPSHFATNESAGSYEQCRLRAVVFEKQSGQNLIILRSVRDGRIFVIPTGFIEASTIYNLVATEMPSLPPTHRLLAKIIEALDSSFLEATVDSFDGAEGCYRARLLVHGREGDFSLACRVSDAAAIALIVNMPLSVRTQFLVDATGIE